MRLKADNRNRRRETHWARRAFLGLMLSGAATSAHAAFQAGLAGPRTAAMGGASLAGLEDSTAMFLNPAGIARVSGSDLSLMYNRLHAGLGGIGTLGQGFISGAVPTKLGTLGLSFANFNGAGLLEERTLAMTFSGNIYGPIDAGISSKLLYHKYAIGDDPLAAADPVFRRGTARSALGLDAGLIASLTRHLKIGIAVRNFNRPDVGLAGRDIVPLETQGGGVYVLERSGLKFTADFTHREGNDGTFMEKYLPSLGLEKSVANGRVLLRTGVNILGFSGGFGVQKGNLGIDYALVVSRGLISNNAGSHMLGLRYEFGSKSPAGSGD